MEWADVVFVMEQPHRKKLSRKFADLLKDKRAVCLDVPDNYQYMQAELVDLLKSKVEGIMGLG